MPDFYGPGDGVSQIGDTGFGRLAQGKAALLLAPSDTPHDFAFVPDVARAVVTLLDAPGDAYGQAWDMPCAPTQTPREILTLGATALGVTPKITTNPLRRLPLLGMFAPLLREVADGDLACELGHDESLLRMGRSSGALLDCVDAIGVEGEVVLDPGHGV